MMWCFYCTCIVHFVTFYCGLIVQLFLIFFHFDPQTFVLHDSILFGPNQRIIESNLLTKDKIKRWGIKVEKAPQIDDGFKVLVRNSL